MTQPTEEQLKLNKLIGDLCWILGSVALVLDKWPPSWFPEGYGFVAGFAFFLMAFQSVRRDFGPLNWGCLFQFLLLFGVLMGLIYFII